MRDFPSGVNIMPEEALVQLQAKYQSFEQLYGQIVEIILNRKLNLKDYFLRLTHFFHQGLFDGVLSNAGSFRHAAEPNRGYVGFGKCDVRQPSGAQFNGTPAEQIEEKVKVACELFSWEDKDPVRTSAIFYQRFVRIHPFYDANGRIGRALVTMYLRLHGYQLLWRKLETTSKYDFIKKLNDCHKRENSPTLPEYEEILVRFWKKFIVPLSEIAGTDESNL